MWKVHLARHMHVRPQFLVGLVVMAAMLYGTSQAFRAPAQGELVVATKPQVAAAFIVTPPPKRPPVDCTKEACLALTFDDGPRADVTPRVLDTLAKHQARATFFVLGSQVGGNEGLLRRMYQEGHEIGNHSWSHPHFPQLSSDAMREQIHHTQAAVAKAGVPAPKLFRPPYGDTNSVVEATVPMTMALWNVDPEDWRHKNYEDILRTVKEHAKPGRVIVLHDTNKPTADCLDQLVSDLQKDYRLVTFSELFNLTASQPGKYYGR